MTSAIPKKSYHHGDLRGALLAAAERLMAERADTAFTLREVARAAGVSHNAPYNHFADRRALLAALAARGFGDLADAMTRALAELGAADPKVGLRTIARVYVAFAAEHASRYRLMFSAELAAYDGAELQEASTRAFSLLEGLVDRARATGGAKPEPDEAPALAAWALVHGLSMLLLDSRIPPPSGDRTLAALTDAVAATLVDGLAD